MSISNILILLVSLTMAVFCLFPVSRLLEPWQDIYLGITVSKKEVFRITFAVITLISFSVYFGIIAFFTIQYPFMNWNVPFIMMLMIIPVGTIFISFAGVYWSYFLIGKFRNWLYDKYQK